MFPHNNVDSAEGVTKPSWTPGTTGTALTGTQQTQLQLIRDRDTEFDADLDEIGEGIQDLHELALRQGEEVRRQNAMLSNTQTRMDNAHEHMTNVNSKMKETLQEVGRSSDKLCVDIMCIVSKYLLFVVVVVFVIFCSQQNSRHVKDLYGWIGWFVLQGGKRRYEYFLKLTTPSSNFYEIITGFYYHSGF